MLQEQSEIPSVEQLRQSQMYPAARELVRLVRAHRAQPMFFETWAHQGGWPVNGLADFTQMQTALDRGYQEIAAEQHVPMAPVGDAWAAALRHPRVHDLWQDDGSHPSAAGTYLAACVFYATIFHASPHGLAYRDGLPDAEATTLQEMAAVTVLSRSAMPALR